MVEKLSGHSTFIKNTLVEEKKPQENESLPNLSWKLKFVILVSMLIMPVGCHYMEATLSTLKATLKEKVDINNTEFGILMSAVTVVNTVLALLAGIFADDFSSNAIGTIRGTLFVNVLIFIGSLITLIGVQKLSFNTMIAGQVIFALGDCVIVTFQEAILSRWFRNKQLTIVMGLVLSMTRLTKFIAKLTCYPLVNFANDFTRPVLVSLIFCGISIAANIAYWIIMYESGLSSLSGKELYAPVSNSFYHQNNFKGFFSKLKLFLYLPTIFWMIPWLQLTLSGVLSSFDDVSTEFVQVKFSTNSVSAGYQSSMIQLIPIVVAPLSGVIIDRFGHRLYFLITGAVCLLVGLLLLQYTNVLPIVGILLISCTFALAPIGILSASSLLLPLESTGLAIGVKKSSNNVGSTILSIIVGYIQDLTFHDGDVTDNLIDQRHQYRYVMVFFIAIAGIAIFLAILFWLMDRHYLNGWLQANKKERERRLEAFHISNPAKSTEYSFDETENTYKQSIPDDTKENKDAMKLIGYQLKQKKSYIYCGFYAFWVIAAWAIFFTFALMPIYQHYDV